MTVAISRPIGQGIVVWTAFAVVHVLLSLYGLNHPVVPLNDVSSVYLGWAQQALNGSIIGVTVPAVYPALAIVPMMASLVAGPTGFTMAWLVIVTATNAVVLATILAFAEGPTDPAKRMVPTAAWWWIGFLAALGPVALGRIDAITSALVVLALVVAARHPRLAAILLAGATWVKVWPAAVAAALVAVLSRRFTIAISYLVTAVGVLIPVVVLGGFTSAFGFLTAQSARGLQIEAPISTIWLWLAKVDPASAQVYFDTDIITFQVNGPGHLVAAAVMTPLLGLVLCAVLALGYWVSRTREDGEVLAWLSLAVILVLIVFNKVGSPQFMVWLAGPVVLGLLGSKRHSSQVAVVTLAIAALTQLIYPLGYDALVTLDATMLVIITLRNVLLIALLVYAVIRLIRLPHRNEI